MALKDPRETRGRGPGDREPPLGKYCIKYYIYKMALKRALGDPSPGDPWECGLNFDTPPLYGRDESFVSPARDQWICGIPRLSDGFV